MAAAVAPQHVPNPQQLLPQALLPQPPAMLLLLLLLASLHSHSKTYIIEQQHCCCIGFGLAYKAQSVVHHGPSHGFLESKAANTDKMPALASLQLTDSPRKTSAPSTASFSVRLCVGTATSLR
jgi:hypothetical protein